MKKIILLLVIATLFFSCDSNESLGVVETNSIIPNLFTQKNSDIKKFNGKVVIGYFPTWDIWKGVGAGYSEQHLANQLNIPIEKYSIINCSFFGLGEDGSLHSGDLRKYNPIEKTTSLLANYYDSYDFPFLIWGM